MEKTLVAVSVASTDSEIKALEAAIRELKRIINPDQD
jgi:hypothetical protein